MSAVLKVAARLRAWRVSQNITQQELAKALNCHVNYIHAWERGHRLIPAARLLRLAQVTEVDLNYILQGKIISPMLCNRLPPDGTPQEQSLRVGRGKTAKPAHRKEPRL